LLFKLFPLRIVAISDTHSKHHSIKIPKGDILVHAGDVSLRGTKEEVIDFLQWFSKQRFQHKILIAGNHDFYFEKTPTEEIQTIIPENVIYLKDSGTEINGIRFWGSPVTPWFFNWAFNRKRGEQIRKHWEMIPFQTNVLITHGPVYGFLDTLGNEQHAGCQDLLRRVLLIKPILHVCGHIHESHGSIHRSGVQFINACQLNGHYDLVHKPIVFDL
jgi:Icc-related predicted phosphoesterase